MASAKTGFSRFWLFLLCFFLGMLIGSIIGEILLMIIPDCFLHQSISFGTQGTPAWLDLFFMRIAFGISFKLNFGSLLGIFGGIAVYRWIK